MRLVKAAKVQEQAQDDDNHKEEDALLSKIRKAAPRTYYFFIQLVLPLLSLIAMSFFFGWLLARFEMEGEIRGNDDQLQKIFRSYANHTTERNEIWNTIANTSVQCTVDTVDDQVIRTIPNLTNTVQSIQDCSFDQGKERFPYEDLFLYVFNQEPDLTFNWMNCYDKVENETSLAESYARYGLNPKNNHHEQYFRYILNFGYDMYDAFVREYPDIIIDVDFVNLAFHEPLPHSDVLVDYVNNSTGSNGCTVHFAGGALFWFTIMTTIGYGNTAPITDGGRLLVFTCGFINIIGFLILNNTASKFWRHTIEDIFVRWHMGFFVTGPFSIVFWLCMTILWMLVVALAMQYYGVKRTGGEFSDFSLSDAYWFSYITTTTVGLGDIHIVHEEFTVGDMFAVPLLVLIGFNFLDIFMEKGIELHYQLMPDPNGLRELLIEERRTDSSKQISQQQRVDEETKEDEDPAGTVRVPPPVAANCKEEEEEDDDDKTTSFSWETKQEKDADGNMNDNNNHAKESDVETEDAAAH